MAEMLDRGRCRGCPADVVWIRTEQGKRVPCNVETYSGYILAKGAKPEGWRQGYTIAGRVVRILPDAAPRPLLPDDLTEDRATIRETHFATCPRRRRFRRIQDERKRQREKRREP